VVRVNPKVLEWIKEKALTLLAGGVSEPGKKAVHNMIFRMMQEGRRTESIVESVKRNIGLDERWTQAVQNREALMREQGIPEAEVQRLSTKYTEELTFKRAERIARTETIAAQAQGRLASWTAAQEAGELPDVHREWIALPESPRTCKICIGLDGNTAEIGGTYTSDIIGEVGAPPAHPHCRCTEVLRRGPIE
jgi:SPP1 gp7 family putative phage head morphogenesis protein